MELNKYKNDGWGLSILGFSKLLDIITESNKDVLEVLEFGSGTSTRFFTDVVKEGVKKLNITSFDNDLRFAYNKTPDETYLNLIIRPLEECTDENYNVQFNNKTYFKHSMHPKMSPLTPVQKNNFYDLEPNDLNGVYDIVLLDGPNGNGRNFAFLHIKDYVKTGSYIYIDDYNHYDFLEKCLELIDSEIIFRHTEGIGSDNFVILKVK